VRIFDTVQYHDQRVFAATRRHNVIEIAILFRRSRGDEPLMGRIPGKFVELFARQNAYWDPNLPALVDHPPQPNIFPFFGNTYPLKISPTRLQRLRDRINSVKNIHAV
jgi:hypothetical protein